MLSPERINKVHMAFPSPRRFALFSMLVLLAAQGARAQHQTELDSLTSEVAAKIQGSTKGPTAGTGVLVVRFENRLGPASELDDLLTKEFADSLRKRGGGLLVLNRDDLKQAITARHLPEATISNAGAMRCYAPDLGAAVLISGTLEYAPDGAVLDVETALVNKRQSFFRKKVILPLTSQMRDLITKLTPDPPPFFTSEVRVWVNPEHPPLSDDKVLEPATGGDNSLIPKCVSCYRPDFSEDAMKVRMMGTIELRVQILADGFPAKISLVRGLPCGLTDNAFEAVEHWKFTPPTRPDGTPVAVVVPVEVVFRLY